MSRQTAGVIDPQRLAEEIEELEHMNDILAMRLARYETANEEFVPGEVVDRLHRGEAPARVWREYRGLTIAEVATAAGLAESAIAEIETGAETVSLTSAKRIARALGVDVDDLVPWPQAEASSGLDGETTNQ